MPKAVATKVFAKGSIVERLLSHIEDFETLASLIFTSKKVYEVFHKHKKTTLKNVATVVSGFVLPQAIRVARYGRKDLKKRDRKGKQKAKAGKGGMDIDVSDTESDTENEDKHEDEDVDMEDADDDDDESDEDESDGEGDGWKRESVATRDPNAYPKLQPETFGVGPLTAQDIKYLAKHARVVRTVEDIFSRRHKDRLVRSSTLSIMEAGRFSKAMYRILLFAKAFPAALYANDKVKPSRKAVKKIRKTQQKFFDDFSTTELRETHAVLGFLVRLIASTGDVKGWSETLDEAKGRFVLLAYGFEAIDVLLSSDDSDAQQLLEDITELGFPTADEEDEDEYEKHSLHEYLLNPLVAELTVRKIMKVRDIDSPDLSLILDDAYGDGDKCAHCKYGGHELYNEQNWHMLDIYFKEYKRDLKGLLPGFLNENPFEQDYYDTHLHHDRDLHSFDFNSMMKDMYSSGMKRSDFSKWNPGDWTCGNCTVKFMENHIHLWFTAQKRKAGEKIPRSDCWYGFNCRTMVHSKDHAEKLNHMCVPKRK